MKFTIPTNRRSLVPRTRLFTMLTGWAHTRLISFIAPAGYGKTSLAAAWLRHVASMDDVAVAWWALDDDDDTPDVFSQRLITAISRALPHIAELEAAQRSGELSGEALLQLLLERLTTTTQPLILVLDDVHRLRSDAVHANLQRILDQMPECLHLMLLSRTPPPLRLSRLRLAGAVLEFSERDLAFDHGEFLHFVDCSKLAFLSPEERSAVEQRTEGWIAALQLTDVALRNRHGLSLRSMHSPAELQDFLHEEIFRHLPEHLQQDLIHLAVLPYLSTSIAAATLGRSQEQAALLIQHILRSHLLVIPYEDVQGRTAKLRLHHLFQDFLLHEFTARAAPEERSATVRRAAHALAAADDVDAGIHLLLVNHDATAAAELLADHSRRFLRDGQFAQLRRWLQDIPSHTVEQHAQSALDAAWMAMLTGNSDMRSRLRTATAAVQRRASAAQAGEWQAECHVIDGLCAFIEVDMNAARAALIRAETTPHDPDGLAACFRILLSTYITNYIPNYHERIRLMQIAAEKLENLGFVYAAIDARITQAALRIRFLDGNGGLNSLNFALASHKRSGRGAAPDLHFYRGEALYLLNRTSEARAEFDESMHAHIVGGSPRTYTYFTRIMLQLCNLVTDGDTPIDDAEDVHDWADALRYFMPAYYGSIGWMRIVRDQLRGMEHRCALTASDLGVLPSQLNADTPAWITLCVLAGAIFSNRELPSLEPHLAEAITWFEETAYHASALRAHILHVLLLSKLDKPREAQRTLQYVLADVERSQLHRLILDFPALDPHLRTNGSPFARVLADRMRIKSPQEALTERELEVLHLFNSQLVGKEIAAALSISNATLHVHTRNIFRKLGVHSRAEALRRLRGI